jgi:uncharacterized HAD superfamily protein
MSQRVSLRVLAVAAALTACACAGARAKRSETYGARKGLAQELVRRDDWSRAFALVDAL